MRVHELQHSGWLARIGFSSRITALRWRRACARVLLIFFVCAGQAHAGVEACYSLVNSFKPNDVNLAYQFVKDHGECVANFEDPAFQTVAGTLTSLTLGGAIHAGQCSSLMGNPNSQAAQQLLSVAGADVVGNYLNCGCAVADSGIADKIKDLVDDVVSCAEAFDPSGTIGSGMKMAGDKFGLSTLWGLESNAHDPRAGQGNGGAPTSEYAAPACGATGIPITSMSTAWDGSPLGAGWHVQSCECPPPTRLYADHKFVQGMAGFYAAFHDPTFRCMVCPEGSAKDSYGNCSICENKSGPNGIEIWQPNKDGSACALVRTEVLAQDQAVMDAAAAAGCPNNGTVQSIHCDSSPAWAACVKALPAQKAACQVDFIATARNNAKLIFDAVSTADSPCELNDRTISCVHPIQQKRCESTEQAISDAWSANDLIGVHCMPLESPAYEQLKQQAQSVVAAMNATYDPNSPPTLGCAIRRDDPLVISCDQGFQWDAVPERAAAVRDLLYGTEANGRPKPIFCPDDVDHDGAEAPCIDGQESPALSPMQPIQQQPATRMRRALPIIRKDGGGGG